MEINDIIKQFNIKGEIKSVSPLGNGHINDTLLVTTDCEKYTFQRINTDIFKSPDELMENLFVSDTFSFIDNLYLCYIQL